MVRVRARVRARVRVRVRVEVRVRVRVRVRVGARASVRVTVRVRARVRYSVRAWVLVVADCVDAADEDVEGYGRHGYDLIELGGRALGRLRLGVTLGLDYSYGKGCS